jgi:hypothetical protein
MGIVRYSITLLDPKKRSPSRLRLGDCAADPRSVAAKVITECRSATPVYDPCSIFLMLYFNMTVKLS